DSRRHSLSFTPQGHQPPIVMPTLTELQGGTSFTGGDSGGSGATTTAPLQSVDAPPANVPEPGTIALGGLMLAGIAALRRRRRVAK
ncbi:MAG: PEP-CTERM sorting domain-containing protein, partial [Burkholderiales bacterium]